MTHCMTHPLCLEICEVVAESTVTMLYCYITIISRLYNMYKYGAHAISKNRVNV